MNVVGVVEDCVKTLPTYADCQDPFLVVFCRPPTPVHHPQETGLDPGHAFIAEVRTSETVRNDMEWNEWMFNDTPARKTDRLLGVRKR